MYLALLRFTLQETIPFHCISQEHKWKNRPKASSGLISGLIFGLIFGLISGLSSGLISGLSSGLIFGPTCARIR